MECLKRIREKRAAYKLSWALCNLSFDQRIRWLTPLKHTCINLLFLTLVAIKLSKKETASEFQGILEISTYTWSREKKVLAEATHSLWQNEVQNPSPVPFVLYNWIATTEEGPFCSNDTKHPSLLYLLLPGARPQRGRQLCVPSPSRKPGRCREAVWPCWACCGRNPSR